MTGTKLIVWAPCQKPSESHLPTLDPDSLYAASILQARRVSEYSIGAPSSLLHSRVPCLEEIATGVILAQDIDGIDRFARKHSNLDSSLLDDEEGDTDGSIDNKAKRRRWAQRKAMERYILSTLHPLIHQIIFSQELYASHTAKVYQSGLSILNRGSLISRLRREMRQHYAMKAKEMETSRDTELCAILAESNAAQYIREEEERERQDLADRGGIARDGKKRTRLSGVRGDGLLQEEKAAAGRAFSEMRLRTYASKLFDVLTEVLGSDDFFYSSDKPSLLDLRLFSLLAPMLLPKSYHSKLAASSIPTLLRSSYPTLIKHTERVQVLIWPIEVQPLLEAHTGRAGNVIQKQFVSTPGWPEIAGRQDEMNDEASAALTIRLASGLGRVCGQTYYYASSLVSTVKDSAKQEPKQEETKTQTKKPVMTSAEKSEARRVAIGRWIWVSSAVIGLIGTAFASGLLSIAFVGEDDDEEDTEAGEREIVELVQAKLAGSDDAEALEEALEDNTTEVDDEEEYEFVVVDGGELDEQKEEEDDIDEDE